MARKAKRLPRMTSQQQTLAADNVRLAGTMATKFVARFSSRLSLDSALSVARYGLCLAAIHFDPARGIRFSTYACRSMWHHLQNAAMDEGGVVSLPKHFCRKGEKYMSAANREAGSPVYAVPSLDEEMDDGERDYPLMLRDTVPDRRYPAPEDAACARSNAQRVRLLLAKLPIRTATILRLTVMEGYTLREAGEAVGVSPERVRQLKYKALAKLRAHAEARANG